MEMINQFRTLITVLFAHKQKQENTERVENGEEAALRLENEELKRTIDTLTIKNREIQQLMVHKIRETDDWGHEHEAKYKEAIRRADELEKLHNSFFVEAVHEMRTPLSLILGCLGQLVQNRELDGLVSTQVLSAYRNTLALQDMMYQLQDIRHGDDVANHMRIARYDLVDITKQICDLFVDWIAMNNIDFKINTQTPVLWVWVDRRKMEYALRTLLSNSLKNTFMYGKITIDIKVVRIDGKACCSLSVHDDGLDAQDSARIGLKQISDMAETVHAKFIQETMEGQSGTRCTILIPLGKRSLMELPVEFVEPDSDLVNLNEFQKEEIAGFVQLIPQKKETGKKLLVIDDSDQIRWFLKLALGKEYRILEAHNGEEGVIMAKKERPDGILCDVMMPVKDGFTACREIKTNPATSQTVVIMLTAKVENEDVIAGIEAGADDYITKPFDLEVLRSKLISQLKRRDQMRAFYTQSAPDTEEAAVAMPAPLNEIEVAGNAFMNKIVKIIEEHLDDPCFDAKFLADEMSMSIPTLYRRVKAFSNCSILELTRSVRIKHAAELILQQRYSIIEVCEMVGFNDMATFRKRFTEQYGVNPSQYGQPTRV
ncbi:response regulator [Parabacteroides sp. AF17-3]|uniref:hybrid sensor histidine kinase/response regulator transcription factor n=1 Tax=Parabacteroides sp. AF17-3 TaxID=2293113 RepID=UPI000EFF7F63|nr:response regulator [Parabacteroides sp. AF17-3]RKU71137.1 response regulator [Parabacteroides sp. AF17-3]